MVNSSYWTLPDLARNSLLRSHTGSFLELRTNAELAKHVGTFVFVCRQARCACQVLDQCGGGMLDQVFTEHPPPWSGCVCAALA